DLKAWLRGLEGCPSIDRTVVATCRRPVHGDEPATWFYVEADAQAGVGRMRCLACGDVRPLLDSAERWTFPPAWSCFNCSQSIAEVAFGVHENLGRASWLVMSVRCVECGHLAGLTDLVVPDLDADALAASL
ncbi:MAG: hypothetical protein QOJ03_1979, partial [Frankiaceae bacterium]|nr:hypothetical protein [Frankiaceae bacterium]